MAKLYETAAWRKLTQAAENGLCRPWNLYCPRRSGIKNGQLLQVMMEDGFDALLTFDKNLQHQPNFQNTPLLFLFFPHSAIYTLSWLNWPQECTNIYIKRHCLPGQLLSNKHKPAPNSSFVHAGDDPSPLQRHGALNWLATPVGACRPYLFGNIWRLGRRFNEFWSPHSVLRIAARLFVVFFIVVQDRHRCKNFAGKYKERKRPRDGINCRAG